MSMTVDLAISAFGAKAKDKLTSPAAAGQPEDQLRAPFEKLLGDVAELANFQPGKQWFNSYWAVSSTADSMSS